MFGTIPSHFYAFDLLLLAADTREFGSFKSHASQNVAVFVY
jgi:hypothetical protein